MGTPRSKENIDFNLTKKEVVTTSKSLYTKCKQFIVLCQALGG